MKAICKHIYTSIGKIAVYIKENKLNETPIIFLHGVYFDHLLWKQYSNSINDRTVIAIDMPLHGKSQEDIKNNWNLDDCAQMLVEILNSLQIPKAIAVGHSWGSMTLLRAANKYPDRFVCIGLCNMPFLKTNSSKKVFHYMQHSLLVFRNIYTKQAAKSLFGKNSLKENPKFYQLLKRPMNLLSNSQIREINKTVIIKAEDSSHLIKSLKVKAFAINGQEDFVPSSIYLETLLVKGGHVSPLETPQEVNHLIKKLINYNCFESVLV